MTESDAELKDARLHMVREIEKLVGLLPSELGLATISPRVLDVLGEVPRHDFVPPESADCAYLNRPVAIGYGQTISQPFIVALMTDLLELGPKDRVLEVGTGSGYQTAVLARLAEVVFTIELCEPLAKRAQDVFDRLGITNVVARVGDGHLGWPSAAPFDAIVVTAAPHHIPAPLITQLKAGGRMVIPVGAARQKLVVVEKSRDGETSLSEIIPVSFVPLTRRDDLSD